MHRTREIDHLEARIKELRVECERFFNGALATPPEKLREGIAQELKRLRQLPLLSTASRYRLAGLEARLNSQVELFLRRLRQQEEGIREGSRSDPEPEIDPWRGVVVTDGAVPPKAVAAIYAALCRGPQPPRFDLESLGSYLTDQVKAIRARTGCGPVRFRLVDEEGQPRLKAKPLPSAS